MVTKHETEAAEREVSENYKYFQDMLPEWRKTHVSGHVLIHHQKCVDFFESSSDAIQVGIKDYGLGKFSVQSIQNIPVDLGHQSNVLFC